MTLNSLQFHLYAKEKVNREKGEEILFQKVVDQMVEEILLMQVEAVKTSFSKEFLVEEMRML